jgi:hypothetical protein
MKNIVTFIVLLFVTILKAQTKQPILISHKYDFQKEADSYNINNMFKGVLMSSFEVYFEEEELPIEIAQNRCHAIKAELIDRSNFLVTRLKFVIKDCQNKILFESNEVKSTDKSTQMGYIETIKMLGPEVKRYMATKGLAKKTTESTDIQSVPNEKVVTEVAKNKLLEIQNGFAVLDPSQKVILQIYKTSVQDFFIADKFGKRGIFYKKENRWYFEYYENDKLIKEEYVF